MHEKSEKIAIRFYANQACQNKVSIKTTQGMLVEYNLISLPFYLIEQIYRLIKQFSHP